MLRSFHDLLEPRAQGSAGLAVALARIAAGLVFIAFSLGKFTRHEAEAGAFERYGIPLADQAAYLTGAAELVCGVLLVVGLATRPAALVLALDMVGAIATAGRVDGGPVHLGLAPALLIVMIVLVREGAGRPSLDGLLARRPRLSG